MEEVQELVAMKILADEEKVKEEPAMEEVKEEPAMKSPLEEPTSVFMEEDDDRIEDFEQEVPEDPDFFNSFDDDFDDEDLD